MSRRSATTLTIQLRLRLPPGAKVPQLAAFITSALRHHKSSMNAGEPLGSLDLDSMQLKVAKRETVYL